MNKLFFYILTIFLCIITTQPLCSQVNNPQYSLNGQEDNIFYHTVERGQTIYGISIMYGVSENDIYQLNPTSREYIKVGEKLKIPQKGIVASSKEKTDKIYTFHAIQTGETLYGVSRHYNVSVEQISKANPGLTSQTFAAGKTIRIPATQIESLPTTEIKKITKEIEYKIKKKETMYSLCKKFSTTSDKLVKINPELKAGLKAGMIIKIPMETQESVTTTSTQNEFDFNALTAYRNENQKVDVIKISLLLPFQSTDSKASGARTEYYEGFLMAIDSMRNLGVSIDLSVYDIGDGIQKTKEVLKNEALLSSNLLIGGVSNEQIELIADFALKNEIKYVIPFSAKCDKLTSNNAYIFQVNTPYQYLYSYATSLGCSLFSGYNIIFVNTNDKDDKTAFVNTFKADLTERNIAYKELTFNVKSFQADLTRILSTTKPNLIVPVSSSIEALTKIKGPLRILAETKFTNNLTLFGYPEWQTYTSECLDDYFALNAHIYTSFYANNLSHPVQQFNAKYRYWYKKNMIASYPKYAMLGFDTGLFFISAIQKYGSNFENNIEQMRYNSIQSGFNFKRVNNWGGFINTNLYIVQFNRDYTITRTEK